MFRIPFLCCLFFVLLITLSCGDKPDVYSITIPALKAAADESVVSLDLSVNAGTVQSVSNIPIGWQIRVDNDASWVSKIKATSTIGNASLSADELKSLALNVRRNESGNAKFDISGIVSLSKAFENRKLAIKMEDFALAAGQ